MPSFIDLTGKVFNYLAVEKLLERKSSNGSRYWQCACVCGEITEVRADCLKNNSVLSCGCIKKHPQHNASKHGLTHTPEYSTWQALKARCNNPNSKRFYSYGGRGIAVSIEWENSFETFLHDMGLRPSDTHSIERVDVNKGYSKDNYVWATRLEQANNTRSNRPITYNGETLNLSQWARKVSIPVTTLLNRLDTRHMTVEEAFTFKAWQRT